MIVEGIHKSLNSEVCVDDLLTKLSQITLALTDDEIKRESQLLVISKTKLDESKSKLKAARIKLDVTARDYQRLKVMKSVLIKINALKKEGVLVGENKNKIKKLLSGIESKPLRNLRLLEDKLSTYVPEASEKVFYN